MDSSGEPKGIIPAAASAQRELPAQKSNLHRFMEKNRNRFDVIRIEKSKQVPSEITLFIPKSELEGVEKQGNRAWYIESVQRAAELNNEVFHTLQPQMNYLFVDTTQEWNDYVGEGSPLWKTKGDRRHGLSGDDILCFTPKGMQTETNAEFEQKKPSEYVQMVLDHETAHKTIHYKYGEEERRFPNWINEGLPMLVCNRLQEATPMTQVQRLYDFLKDYTVAPSDTILSTERYPGREANAPVMYTYGEQFLKWLVLRDTTVFVRSDAERKALVIPLLDSMSGTARSDFKISFQKVFGMSYQSAYENFVKYLRQQCEIRRN